jgi:glycine cleavage system H lipoate-binding protein
MSILITLLTFLLLVAISWLRKHQEEPSAAARWQMWLPSRAPRAGRNEDLEIPKGYCFHPLHTWMVDEGLQEARVGLDGFVADLVGKIDRVEVPGLDRWVRQGQKLMTVVGEGVSLDLPSPAEGALTAVNRAVLKDPSLAISDPYRRGWIVVIKSPDIVTNQRNLIQGAMVVPWMRHNLKRLNDMVSQVWPALAQGRLPLRELLARLSPEMRSKLVREFFPT